MQAGGLRQKFSRFEAIIENMALIVIEHYVFFWVTFILDTHFGVRLFSFFPIESTWLEQLTKVSSGLEVGWATINGVFR